MVVVMLVMLLVMVLMVFIMLGLMFTQSLIFSENSKTVNTMARAFGPRQTIFAEVFLAMLDEHVAYS